MFYEVTGRKLKGDGYALESCSSDEEACKGTDSDIGSPKGQEGRAIKTTTNAKSNRKIDIDELQELLVSMMENHDEEEKRE